MPFDPASMLLLGAGASTLIAVAVAAVVVNALPIVGSRRIPALGVLTLLSLIGLIVLCSTTSNLAESAGRDAREALVSVLTMGIVGVIVAFIAATVTTLAIRFAGRTESLEDDDAEVPVEEGRSRPRRSVRLSGLLTGWTVGLACLAAGAIIGSVSAIG